ncbi:MAG TPA: peptidoglycan-binding domain-containing protein [Trichocoleus sp.]
MSGSFSSTASAGANAGQGQFPKNAAAPIPDIFLAQTPDQGSGQISDRISRPTLRLGSQGEAVSELQAMLKLLGFYTGTVNGQFQEPTQSAVQRFQSAAGLNPDGIVGSATWSQLLPTPPSEANPPTAAGGSTTPPSGSAAAPTSTPAPTPAPTPASTPAAQTSPQPAAPASSPPAAGQTPRPSNTAPPAAGGSSGATALPVLRPGMRGDAVTRLQERLKALGFYRGTVDGIFGAQTEQAVKQAQQQYRLEPDGIVGPATWDAIL